MPQRLRFINVAIVLLLLFTLASFAYERNGTWETPVVLMRDVIKKSPRKLRSYNNMGYYYFKKGMLDDALNAFRTSVALNPNYAKGLCNVGGVYVEKKSYDDAIWFLTRAVALDPNFDLANFNLGLAYEAKGQRELALQYYEKAASHGHEGARIAIERVLREASTPHPLGEHGGH